MAPAAPLLSSYWTSRIADKCHAPGDADAAKIESGAKREKHLVVFPPEGFPSSQKMSTTAGLGCFGQRETAVSAFLDYPPECWVLPGAKARQLSLSHVSCAHKKNTITFFLALLNWIRTCFWCMTWGCLICEKFLLLIMRKVALVLKKEKSKSTWRTFKMLSTYIFGCC